MFHISDANSPIPGDDNGLLDVILYDRQEDTYELISVASDETQGDGQSRFGVDISRDGRFVARNC